VVVLQHEMQYGRLVRQCLRAYGILCLGVYRLLDEVVDDKEVKGQRTLTQKRYVITHPPINFRLMDSDKVVITSVLLVYRFAAGTHGVRVAVIPFRIYASWFSPASCEQNSEKCWLL